VCAVRDAEWEPGRRQGRANPGTDSGIQAEYKRNTGETQATHTLPTGGQCRGWTGPRASPIAGGARQEEESGRKTMITSALLLLPFGASTVRMLRKTRAA
jgi:hypothetical protein